MVSSSWILVSLHHHPINDAGMQVSGPLFKGEEFPFDYGRIIPLKTLPEDLLSRDECQQRKTPYSRVHSSITQTQSPPLLLLFNRGF